MQSEVKSWLEKVGYLTDAVKLEAECVKLIRSGYKAYCDYN